MIGRFFIATLLTATTLAGVALQRGDARPGLLLFSDSANCPPCRSVDRDYDTIPAFRDALNRRYHCKPKFNPRDHADMFRLYQVQNVPTWIVTDAAGRELHRLEGYSTPAQLLRELSQKCENGVCRPITQSRPEIEPPVQRPPAQPPARAPDADRMERLQNANSALEREVDGLRGQQQDLKRQLLDAKRQPADDPAVAAQVADLKRQQARLSAELAAAEAARKQAAAEADELRRRIDQPAAPPAVQTPETPETPPPAAAVRSGDAADVPAASGLDDLLSRWGGTLGSVAIGAARIAAPEFAIPITAAVGAITWWRRKKKTGRRVSNASAVATDDAFDNGLPRDNTEIEQIIGLRQQEQREPIHDAFFGVLFEDEYRTNPDKPVREAWANALDRFNRTAPLSTRCQTTSTTTEKG